MKLQKLLTEVLNTYSVEVEMKSNRDHGLMGILDEVRAIQKITIVQNISPTNDPRYSHKKYINNEMEFTRLSIKWVSRTNPVDDMKGFKKAMMHTEEEGATGVKIPGVVSATFKTNTLKRV